MLASRLVKSCLFGLVALMPLAAEAGYIIDSFTGSGTHGLPGGITVSRTTPGGSLTFNGVDATSSVVADGNSFNIRYVFSAPLGNTGDLLGGTPGLKIDFTSATGSFNVLYRLGGVGTFTSLGSIAAGGPSSVSGSAGTIAAFNAATELWIRLNNTSGGDAQFTIDRVTATPEPTTLIMFASVAGAGFVARKRLKRKSNV